MSTAKATGRLESFLDFLVGRDCHFAVEPLLVLFPEVEEREEKDIQEGTALRKKHFVFFTSLEIFEPYLLLMTHTSAYSEEMIRMAKRTQHTMEIGMCLLIKRRNAASSLCHEEPFEILKKASLDNL